MKFIVHKTVLLLLFLFAFSCNYAPLKPEGFPQLYPCTIIVEQEGKPVSDVQVLMRPTDPLVKWSIGGTTNIDGTLEVLTHGVHLGAPAGEYKILLVKQEEEESQYSKIPPSDPTALAQWEENISKEKLGNYSVIDQKYSDVTTTPFIITIKKQKKNSIKCDVGVLVRKRIN